MSDYDWKTDMRTSDQGTGPSVSRQRALLVNADLDEARNWPRGHAVAFVRSDLKEAHRASR